MPPDLAPATPRLEDSGGSDRTVSSSQPPPPPRVKAGLGSPPACENAGIEVPRRRRGLEASVEPCRRVDRLVAEDPADDFVGAGIVVEMRLGAEMAKQMRI